MFSAVLDTSVLWPSTQRDFLLSLAAESLYRPLWSSAILEELRYTHVRKLVQRSVTPAKAESQSAHLVEQMRAAFDDAEVSHWEPYDGTFGLPDPAGEHVLAAAVAGGAGAIVTENLKDFPSARIPLGIQIRPARDFAADTVAVNPRRGLRAVATMSARRQFPPESVDDLLLVLRERYGMDEAVDLIEEAR
ncbi:PIN domain-containing protein [Kribbella albertanoniae]|uniref:PIN domain-containing protein n=1 Tax=Kribbella albertanoniae TaxID=1266829 RepID=A0A4R4PM49_9ACTN|nr:PIN domain-containing protein [Kribbella albertanoniae]TDC23227.1 PIN domain-containing protein [Kribbella albertanoniae]